MAHRRHTDAAEMDNRRPSCQAAADTVAVPRLVGASDMVDDHATEAAAAGTGLNKDQAQVLQGTNMHPRVVQLVVLLQQKEHTFAAMNTVRMQTAVVAAVEEAVVEKWTLDYLLRRTEWRAVDQKTRCCHTAADCLHHTNSAAAVGTAAEAAGIAAEAVVDIDFRTDSASDHIVQNRIVQTCNPAAAETEADMMTCLAAAAAVAADSMGMSDRSQRRPFRQHRHIHPYQHFHHPWNIVMDLDTADVDYS